MSYLKAFTVSRCVINELQDYWIRQYKFHYSIKWYYVEITSSSRHFFTDISYTSMKALKLYPVNLSGDWVWEYFWHNHVKTMWNMLGKGRGTNWDRADGGHGGVKNSENMFHIVLSSGFIYASRSLAGWKPRDQLKLECPWDCFWGIGQYLSTNESSDYLEPSTSRILFRSFQLSSFHLNKHPSSKQNESLVVRSEKEEKKGLSRKGFEDK